METYQMSIRIPQFETSPINDLILQDSDYDEGEII